MISYQKIYIILFKIPVKIFFILKLIFFKYRLSHEKNKITNEYKLSFNVFIKNINDKNYIYKSKTFSILISILINLIKSKRRYYLLRNISNYFDKSLKQKLVNVFIFLEDLII